MAEGEVRVAELAAVNKEPLQSEDTKKQTQPPRLCRFYSQGRFCQFGRRCRFLHQRLVENSCDKSFKPELSTDIVEENTPKHMSVPQDNSGLNIVRPKNHNEPPHKQFWSRKLCRYFASGYCSMETNCRFWHPEKRPAPEDRSAIKKPSARPAVQRPAIVPEEVKATNLTSEMASQLRNSEISQLLKRFPRDKVIIQEREDGKVTYYRITIVPTDPDWPFDLKEMEVLLEFPDDYPLQVFTIQIPEDQDLPSVMGRHVCEASRAWLQGKHATNTLIGKVELLFRPFLHWLDRNMEKLFTEGARLLKTEIDAEKAGLEFVPYQQLQAAISVKSSEEETVEEGQQETNLQESPTEDVEDDDSDNWTSCDDDEEDDDREAGTSNGMRSVEGGAVAGPRKGSEIRFLGLKLGGGVATLMACRIVVSLQCNRCKDTADLSLTGKLPCTAQCEKCNSHISGVFHPSILHQYSTVLGYVDIQGANVKDLILLECTFMIGCLNCSQEEPVQNLSFGVTKDLNCLHCHSKLSIFTEAARFQKLERYPGKVSGNKDLHGYGRKKVRDPAIQSGKPLPDHGTCKHFRKSCRWLRFPCCGKAYPCDGCHDEAEDHEMELASRMLCGYCAKEQPYSNAKPCISCGNMMNKNIHSVHWEGGRGCRNKVKMSRKDKQKYTDIAKTVSRKAKGKK